MLYFITALWRFVEGTARSLLSVLKKLYVSPGNLKRWEGGVSITAEKPEKFANHFGAPVDYFFSKMMKLYSWKFSKVK